MAYYASIIKRICSFFRPKPQYNSVKRNLEEQRELLKKVSYKYDSSEIENSEEARIKEKYGWEKSRLCA